MTHGELGDLWKATNGHDRFEVIEVNPEESARRQRVKPDRRAVADSPSPCPKPLSPMSLPAEPADLNHWKSVLKRPKRGVPEGLWRRCPGCQATIFRKEAEKRLGVCPECDYHWYVPARQRIAQVLDEGTFEEWDADLETADPLEFVDKVPYPQKIEEEQQQHRAARGGGGGHAA